MQPGFESVIGKARHHDMVVPTGSNRIVLAGCFDVILNM